MVKLTCDEDSFRAVNFRIDEQGVMRCPNDKAFHLLYRKNVRGNQYGRKKEVYECEDCSGCPYAKNVRKQIRNEAFGSIFQVSFTDVPEPPVIICFCNIVLPL